jgi:hypothetical protein
MEAVFVAPVPMALNLACKALMQSTELVGLIDGFMTFHQKMRIFADCIGKSNLKELRAFGIVKIRFDLQNSSSATRNRMKMSFIKW